MEIIDTALRDVKLIRPRKFGDERGWFAEVFNAGPSLPRDCRNNLSRTISPFPCAASCAASTISLDSRRENSYAPSPATFGMWPSISGPARPISESGRGSTLRVKSSSLPGFPRVSATDLLFSLNGQCAVQDYRVLLSRRENAASAGMIPPLRSRGLSMELVTPASLKKMPPAVGSRMRNFPRLMQVTCFS